MCWVFYNKYVWNTSNLYTYFICLYHQPCGGPLQNTQVAEGKVWNRKKPVLTEKALEEKALSSGREKTNSFWNAKLMINYIKY